MLLMRAGVKYAGAGDTTFTAAAVDEPRPRRTMAFGLTGRLLRARR